MLNLDQFTLHSSCFHFLIFLYNILYPSSISSCISTFPFLIFISVFTLVLFFHLVFNFPSLLSSYYLLSVLYLFPLSACFSLSPSFLIVSSSVFTFLHLFFCLHFFPSPSFSLLPHPSPIIKGAALALLLHQLLVSSSPSALRIYHATHPSILGCNLQTSRSYHFR